MKRNTLGIAKWHETSHDTKRNTAKFALSHQHPTEDNGVRLCPASINIKASLPARNHDAHKASKSRPYTAFQTQAQYRAACSFVLEATLRASHSTHHR